MRFVDCDGGKEENGVAIKRVPSAPLLLPSLCDSRYLSPFLLFSYFSKPKNENFDKPQAGAGLGWVNRREGCKKNKLLKKKKSEI